MRKIIFVLIFSLSALVNPVFAETSQKAADVLYVSGSVSAGGVPVKKGDSVSVGALLETAADGHVYLKAIDGGFLVVRANSKAVIRAYDISNKQEVRIKIELIEGTARSITGTAAQGDKSGFRFNTPVAAIGVRGTDFTVKTNALETLVAVSSGAVAVSPLSDTCLAAGFGPCKGDLVVDLNATDRGFLRVVKGETAPVLVPDPSEAPTAPLPAESKAKPTSAVSTKTAAEPAATGGTNAAAGGGSAPPELSPVYEEKLASGSLGASMPGPNQPPATPIANPPQPDAAQPAPQQPEPIAESGITWGRWQQVANAAPDSELFGKAIGFSHYGLRLMGPYFLASQREREYSRPVEQQVSFIPVAHEAYLGLRGGVMESAAVSNGRLNVNFDTSQFNTQFNVGNRLGLVEIKAAGQVGALGNLESDIIQSNAQFFGYLEGQGATHGTSIFTTFGDSPVSAAGTVQWSR